MMNVWMCGHRSALPWRSPGLRVQTPESSDSDAWLSQEEGGGVSEDVNLQSLTSTPQFQLQYLLMSGVNSGRVFFLEGGGCKLLWEGLLEVTPHCNLWTGMKWLWHFPRVQLQWTFHQNHMTQQKLLAHKQPRNTRTTWWREQRNS